MHGPAHVNFPMVVVCTLATAACWGTYGPLLQWGHMAMGSGRLRPFICVGIAYVIIAIAAPILVMTLTGMENESGLFSGWTNKGGSGVSGIFWSLMGGTAGALGGPAGDEDEDDYDRDDAGADRDRERPSGRRRSARRNGGR